MAVSTRRTLLCVAGRSWERVTARMYRNARRRGRFPMHAHPTHASPRWVRGDAYVMSCLDACVVSGLGRCLLRFVQRCWPALVGWRFLYVCALGGFLLWFRIAYACPTTASLATTCSATTSLRNNTCSAELQEPTPIGNSSLCRRTGVHYPDIISLS